MQSINFSNFHRENFSGLQLEAKADQKIAILEKELNELKAQLAEYKNKANWLDNLNDPVIVVAKDGTSVYANQAASTFWKNKVNENNSIDFNTIFEDDITLTPPSLAAILENGSELKVKSYAGGVWFSHQIVPLKEENGHCNTLIVHSRDVSECKTIQDEAEKFILLVENSNDMVSLSDTAGNITYINKAGIEQLGLTNLDQARELNMRDIIEGELGTMQDEELSARLAENGVWRGELKFKNLSTNESVPFDVNCFYIYNLLTQQPGHIATVSRNLKSYKATQDHLQNSLQEKEALLSEVHHRVKNNLAVISALLTLQSAHMDDVQVQSFVEDLKHRIKAMAMIHERLYQSDSFSKISMREYIAELANYLHTSFIKRDQEIALELEIDDLYFDITTSVPLGLIVSELLTNAYKYAYAGQKYGALNIKLQSTNEGYILTVADDGVGFTNEECPADSGFGLMLVSSLSMQLAGNFVQENLDHGCICKVSFKEVSLKSSRHRT